MSSNAAATSATTPLSQSELAAWLRLLATSGVGDVTTRSLLTHFGLPEQIFAQRFSSLRRVVSERVALALLAEPDDALQAQIERTWEWYQQPNNHILTLACADYPQRLLDTDDPPAMLYLKGRAELLAQPQALAIVGSRNATAQGIKNTEWFAQDLAAGGCHIVSGLALGIDAAAHQGALNAYRAAATPQGAGSTIAVIGTGCDIIYPARNRDLTYAIAQDGLIVSEFPLGAKAQPTHFPRRNRIISGLAQGVLVVEAALQSGSLITARQALEQNREVFAIPGSIHSPLSKGCHALIKQGAKLVECAQDILDELNDLRPSIPLHNASNPNAPSATTSAAVSAQTQGLLDALGHDPCDVDTLVLRSGLDVGVVLAELMGLELQGQVEKRAGNIYARLL